MSRSKRFLSCSLAMCLSAPYIGSSAAQSRELGSTHEREIAANDIHSPAAACVLGSTAEFSNVVGLMNPGDVHYSLINPADCCNSRIVLRNYVLKLHSDSQQAGCSFTLRATVIGAGGTPACPMPDPSVELCPPQTVTFTPPFTNVYYDAVIPASQNCCINGPAFLSIEVIAADECNRLGLTAEDCTPCQQYYYSSSSGLIEFCSVYNFAHGMYVEADCCQAVPIDGRPWGTIKALYR